MQYRGNLIKCDCTALHVMWGVVVLETLEVLSGPNATFRFLWSRNGFPCGLRPVLSIQVEVLRFARVSICLLQGCPQGLCMTMSPATLICQMRGLPF